MSTAFSRYAREKRVVYQKLIADFRFLSSINLQMNQCEMCFHAGAYVDVLNGASVVMLQREVPEHVNEAVAEAAFLAGVPVFQVRVPLSTKPSKPGIWYFCMWRTSTILQRVDGLLDGS